MAAACLHGCRGAKIQTVVYFHAEVVYGKDSVPMNFYGQRKELEQKEVLRG